MNGAQLTEWRRAHGYTQAQLAGRIGVNANTVARYERDDLAIPPLLPLALNGLLFTHGAGCTCVQCERRWPRAVKGSKAG